MTSQRGPRKGNELARSEWQNFCHIQGAALPIRKNLIWRRRTTMAHSIRGLFPSLRARRKVAAVTTSTLLVFGAANAQETTAGEGGESMQLQEIVVTGSRIRRSDTATAAPITVVDQQAL